MGFECHNHQSSSHPSTWGPVDELFASCFVLRESLFKWVNNRWQLQLVAVACGHFLSHYRRSRGNNGVNIEFQGRRLRGRGVFSSRLIVSRCGSTWAKFTILKQSQPKTTRINQLRTTDRYDSILFWALTSRWQHDDCHKLAWEKVTSTNQRATTGYK